LPIFFFQALTNITADGIFYLIGIVLLFPPLIWALKQKKRSLGYLLLTIVPFGWIIFLALANKSIYFRVDNK